MAENSLIHGTPSPNLTSMSGAARFGIQRNASRRKKIDSCKQKYKPMKTGNCANMSKQPLMLDSGLTPCCTISFVRSWLKRW